MSYNDYRNAPFETALNIIKQKPLHQVDAEDIAFLKARADYLTDDEKAIYFDGVLPSEVEVDVAKEDANARIIRENRPLVEKQAEEFKALNEVNLAAARAMEPKTPEQLTQEDKAKAKAHADHMKGLNKAADQLAEDAEADAKERAAEAKKAAKEEAAGKKGK